MVGEAASMAKSDLALRCAKAVLLVSSLKATCSPSVRAVEQREEKETMMKVIRELRVELARERFRSNWIELCGSIELVIHVSLLLLSLAAVVLLLGFVPI
ncbi:hypothetical protein LINPERPRIM_LOCUS3360 [Linum perenne]